MDGRSQYSDKTVPRTVPYGSGLNLNPYYHARRRRKAALRGLTPCTDGGNEDINQPIATRRTRRSAYYARNTPRGTKKIKENEEYDEDDDGNEDEGGDDEDDEEHEMFDDGDEENEEIEENDDEDKIMNEDEGYEPLPATVTHAALPATPISIDTEHPQETSTTTDPPADPPRQKRKYCKKPKFTHTLPDWFLAASPAEQFRMTGIMLQHAYKTQLAKTDEAAAYAVRKAKSQRGIERRLNALLEPGKIGMLPVPMDVLERRLRNTWRTEAAKGATVPGTDVNAWRPTRCENLEGVMERDGKLYHPIP